MFETRDIMPVLRHTRISAMDAVQVEYKDTQAEQEETNHVREQDEIRPCDEHVINTANKNVL